MNEIEVEPLTGFRCKHSAPLYYEGHVILRNKPDGQVRSDVQAQRQSAGLSRILDKGWWHSILEEEDGPDGLEKRGDYIVTTRGPSESVLLDRMRVVAQIAKETGHLVIRYKIEVATIDSKMQDCLGVLT